MSQIKKYGEVKERIFPLHPALEDLYDNLAPAIYSVVLLACSNDREKTWNLMCAIFYDYNKSLHISSPDSERQLLRLLRIAIRTGRDSGVHLEPVLRQFIKK